MFRVWATHNGRYPRTWALHQAHQIEVLSGFIKRHWTIFTKLSANGVSTLPTVAILSQTHLHRTIAKDDKPWVYSKTLWYHPLHCLIYIFTWTYATRQRYLQCNDRLLLSSKVIKKHCQTHQILVALAHQRRATIWQHTIQNSDHFLIRLATEIILRRSKFQNQSWSRYI